MNLRLLDTKEQAYEILNYVLDQNVNLIDTARAYNGTNGSGETVESEALVGEVIRRRQDLQEPIVIITKGRGYTVEALDEELATSRRKLGIEGKGDLHIGQNRVKLVYFYHGLNDERWESITTSGALERMQAVKQEGLINYIGFSSHYGNAKEIKKAVDTGIFDVVELPYNIFNRALGEDGEIDLLQYCYERGVGIINMKAFGGNGMVPIFDSLQSYVDIDHAKMLNFCLSNPYITTVDAGARFVEEFAVDLEVASGPRLGGPELAQLRSEADKIAGDLKHVCRECLHCLEEFECPEGLNFPRILALYSRYRIGERLDKDTSELHEAYKQLELNAEACIECGQCVPWCEYQLDIPKMLKAAHEVLSS